MFKMIVFCLFVVYMIGAIAAIFTFIVDVIKWHSREEHVEIIPSSDLIESEVIEFERRDNGRAPERDSDSDNNNSGNFFN